MPPERELICILDDDPSVRDSIEQLLDSDELRRGGFPRARPQSSCALGPARCLDVDMNGLEVQSRLGEVSPDTKVIVMTEQGNRHDSRRRARRGRLSLSLKPCDDEAFLSLSVKESAPRREMIPRPDT